MLSIVYVIWGAWFIFRSSFVDYSGVRHFLLFDDGMISLKYALNIANGFGPVWNIGEFVEGFSNPLWTLIMSFFICVFGRDLAPLCIQLMALLLLTLSGFYIYKLASIITTQSGNKESPFTLLSSVLFFSYYPVSYWSLSGMEVSLLVFLTIVTTYIILKHIYIQVNKYIYVNVFILISIAYVIRPDGFLVLLPLLGMLLLKEYKSESISLVKVSSMLIFCCTILTVSLWRYYAYHDIFPNTYYLKIDGYDLLWRLQNGIGFITPYLKQMSLFIIMSIMFSIYMFRNDGNALWFWLLMMPLISIAYQVYVGGDPWNRWRQLSPSVFILFLPAAIIPSLISTNLFPRVICLSVLGLSFCFSNYKFVREQLYGKLYSFSEQHKQLQFALDLNKVTTRNASVGVFWAGTIPYYFHGLSIDMLGKCDKYISHLVPNKHPSWGGMNGVPGHSKFDLEYSIKQLQPDWIQDYKWSKQDLQTYTKEKYVKVKNDERVLPGCFKKGSNNIIWDKLVVISECK